MCWDANISINTFTVGLFSATIAYANKMLTFYQFCYYLLFTSMQLVEYFVWNNINNKDINHTMSIIAMSIIILLPLVGMFAYMSNESQKLKMSIIYLLFVIAYLCFFYNKINFSMKKASNGHLAWNWMPNEPLIILIWYFLWIAPYVIKKNTTRLILNTIIFFIIYIRFRKNKTYGSLWCWISNFFSLYFIMKILMPCNLL